MKAGFKGFFLSGKGLNTVEVVIILAIVVGIALIFRQQIVDFVRSILGQSLDPDIFTNYTPSPMP